MRLVNTRMSPEKLWFQKDNFFGKAFHSCPEWGFKTSNVYPSGRWEVMGIIGVTKNTLTIQRIRTSPGEPNPVITYLSRYQPLIIER